jgi:hypothetical protein
MQLLMGLRLAMWLYATGPPPLPVEDASVDVAHARFAYLFGARAGPGLVELERVKRRGGSAFVIDNDFNWGEFSAWLRESPWIDPPTDADAAFWMEWAFEMQKIDSDWRFSTREQLERLVRIKFPEDLANRVLGGHGGLTITYGYVLRHHR